MVESVEVVIKQPGHPDRVVRLQEGATRMGRAEDNEVVLSDVGVSRRHAQVYVSRGEVTVEDLGSGNGTYYNGYRIQSQPVQDGDEIVIDPFVLQFRIRGQERAMRMEDGQQGAPARLEVVVGTGMAGSSYPITSRGLSIGRSEDRDVVIPDPAASRHHCQITVQGGDYVLRDMGSANGVFVNAVRVRECTLADGDLIRIGNTEMRFVRYDEHAADNTTQVVSSDSWAAQPSWNEPGLPPPGSVPQHEPPARRSRGRPLLVILFGGLLVVVGFLFVLVIVLAIVVLALQMQPMGPPSYDAQPPRWELQLPPGLEGAPVDVLFDAGSKKMRDGDQRGALQAFYRVMQADPSYPSVEKFAFAAGETMVLGVLEKEFTRVRRVKDERDAERDKLLIKLNSRRPSTRRSAERELEQKFRDDPAVIEALDLKATEEMAAVEQRAAEASDLLAAESFDEAALAYEDVLSRTNDEKLRARALTNLKLARKEVARASKDQWTAGVIADASRDLVKAEQIYNDLLAEHPANPSAEVRLSRLQ